MELKGSKTERNLSIALAGEAEARSVYVYYASEARGSGMEHVADVFEALALNEEEHARRHFELLGRLGDTKANLEAAVAEEFRQSRRVYPEMANTAREEGFIEIAEMFERVAKVEGNHESICRQLLEGLETDASPVGRTVGHSTVRMAQVTQPEQANPYGFVHGGELMKMMDNAAGVAAWRHAGMTVVTARVDNLSFLKPVVVGSLVLIRASVAFVSRSTIEVRVEVETENLTTRERQQALTAYYIMVALDDERRAQQVPPLIVTTEEEARRFEEGRRRYETWKSHRLASQGR